VSPAGPKGGEHPRVLHIEDDPGERDSLAAALGLVGIEVHGVADGAQGIAALESRSVDLVVLDLTLPGVDGLEVFNRIRRLPREVPLPVIFLSGRTEMRHRLPALKAGAVDFCVKPVRVEELEVRIRALLQPRDDAVNLNNETRRLRVLSVTDPLTRLGNRRAFDGEMLRAWARVEETKSPLALLVVDIDHFKSFNDRYGHRTGDEVLRGTARAIETATRKADKVFRYGGEEFVVICADTGADGALLTAERVRNAVAQARVSPPVGSTAHGPLAVTVSLGIALVPDPGIKDPAAHFEAADRALQAAKAAGRNRVIVAAAAPADGVASG
jgi:diguanylate cyclase (GGDEF)-like protein